MNRESWVGSPVPVIPLTITQYCDILKYIYDNNVDIVDFVKLIENLHDLAIKSCDFNEWNENISREIERFKSEATT